MNEQGYQRPVLAKDKIWIPEKTLFEIYKEKYAT